MEGEVDGPVHVQVLIGSKSSYEGNTRFRLAPCLVFLEHRRLLDSTDWVEWDIRRPAGPAILVKYDGLREVWSFPGGEVLVLRNARIWDKR